MGADSGNLKILVVVGRDQGELYEYFRWGFMRVPGVEVVLDRRLGERRGRANDQGVVAERRKSDRRRSAGTRAELLARGFLIARRDPHAGARDWGSLR
jgi:hypothetical protein